MQQVCARTSLKVHLGFTVCKKLTSVSAHAAVVCALQVCFTSSSSWICVCKEQFAGALRVHGM